MKQLWFLSAIVLTSVILFVQCNQADKSDDQARESVETPDGEALARAMCSTCHLYPEPELLDKVTWKKHILPRMGAFLGVYSDSLTRNELIEEGPAKAKVLAENVFPESQLIDSAQWNAIQAFYHKNAPDEPIKGDVLEIGTTEQFKAIRPAFGLKPPSTTFIELEDKAGKIYLGDAFTGTFYALNEQLKQFGAAKTTESPVWMTQNESEFLITVMGSFSPTDAPNGMLISLPKDGGDVKQLITRLQRPVHHSVADLDGDGLEDLIICEFAKWTGSLSWWKNLGGGNYERHILKNEPGSMKAYPRDWNGDGLMDIIALFGQGNEGIWAYINDGNGGFEEETILRFPASYGSSYFKLHDLDGDGDEDIIYCAGDNADFPPILKHYHGIRLYFNNGDNTFDEPIFIQLNGAYAAIPSDFDGDGDMDLAAISFFPDFENHPEEGFVYLENKGDWNFAATTFPEVEAGRWIVMDAGDIDRDGDQDLVLGALTFEVIGKPELVQQWAERGVSFVLLENLAK